MHFQIIDRGIRKMSAQQVLSALREMSCPDKAATLADFFQVYAGGYGEGDKFLGVVVPNQRKVAKQFRELPPISCTKRLAGCYAR